MGRSTVKKLTEEQKKFIKEHYQAPNTAFGIASMVGTIGVLLAIIGLFCPVFSYNPTVVDELKRTVSLFDLPGYALLSFVFIILPFIATLFHPSVAVGENAGRSGKIILLLSVAEMIVVFIGIIVLEVSAIGYEVPEDEFMFLTLNNDAGAIMYIIGCILFCVATLFSGLLYMLCLNGKFELEKTVVFNKRGGAKAEPAPASKQEGLAAWKKLLDEGAITQEEYERKKREILGE